MLQSNLYDNDIVALPQVTWVCVDDQGNVMGMNDHHKVEIDGYRSICIDHLLDHSLLEGLVIIEDGEEISVEFNEDRYNKAQNLIKSNTLRAKRDMECFSYINRGKLWYDITIDTEIKKEEFQKWYQNWLDVTETFEIPEKPEWLV